MMSFLGKLREFLGKLRPLFRQAAQPTNPLQDLLGNTSSYEGRNWIERLLRPGSLDSSNSGDSPADRATTVLMMKKCFNCYFLESSKEAFAILQALLLTPPQSLSPPLTDEVKSTAIAVLADYAAKKAEPISSTDSEAEYFTKEAQLQGQILQCLIDFVGNDLNNNAAKCGESPGLRMAAYTALYDISRLEESLRNNAVSSMMGYILGCVRAYEFDQKRTTGEHQSAAGPDQGPPPSPS